MKNKLYSVPDELVEVEIEYQAAVELRNIYAKRPFGYKKALRASADAVRSRDEFWRKIRELYPELASFFDIFEDKYIKYDGVRKVIYEIDKKDAK